ncbi:hypothetical protein [Nocardiopsis sp. ATB16-24]|nr:hypothetical protein [Nocardiopsis sp. ATB16-24]
MPFAVAVDRAAVPLRERGSAVPPKVDGHGAADRPAVSASVLDAGRRF